MSITAVMLFHTAAPNNYYVQRKARKIVIIIGNEYPTYAYIIMIVTIGIYTAKYIVPRPALSQFQLALFIETETTTRGLKNFAVYNVGHVIFPRSFYHIELTSY